MVAFHNPLHIILKSGGRRRRRRTSSVKRVLAVVFVDLASSPAKMKFKSSIPCVVIHVASNRKRSAGRTDALTVPADTCLVEFYDTRRRGSGAQGEGGGAWYAKGIHTVSFRRGSGVRFPLFASRRCLRSHGQPMRR